MKKYNYDKGEQLVTHLMLISNLTDSSFLKYVAHKISASTKSSDISLDSFSDNSMDRQVDFKSDKANGASDRMDIPISYNENKNYMKTHLSINSDYEFS